MSCSHCSIRAFGGVFFYRVCNGVSSRTPSPLSLSTLFLSIPLRKAHLFRFFFWGPIIDSVELIGLYSGNGLRNLSSSSARSSSRNRISQTRFSSDGLRAISTFSPLCMGRRSEKIAGRKVWPFIFLRCGR